MIHIACGLDNNYSPYCVVMLYSLLENNKQNDITFHILTNNMSESNRIILSKMIDDYKKHIIFYNIDETVFNKLPVGGEWSGHINIAAYFRFLLPTILPDIDKIIYLDSDMIVVSNIAELWNVDVEQYAVAGVRDSENDNIRLYNRLNYDQSLGYINSGVLLINLKEWRKDNFLSEAIKRIASNPKKYCYHDQDFINEFYCDRKLLLDFKFNLMEFYCGYSKLIMNKKHYRDIEEAIKNPVIVHFCGNIKPWHNEYSSPIKHVFCKYADNQPYIANIYKNKRSDKQIIRDKFGNFVYRVLKRLNIPRELSIDKTIKYRYRADIYHIDDY